MTIHHDLHMAGMEIARLRDFADEFIRAWADGNAGDGYLLRLAQEARALTPPASDPRPAHAPAAASAEKD